MLAKIARQLHLHFAMRKKPNAISLAKTVSIKRLSNRLQGKVRRCLKNNRATTCSCRVVTIGFDDYIPAMVPGQNAPIRSMQLNIASHQCRNGAAIIDYPPAGYGIEHFCAIKQRAGGLKICFVHKSEIDVDEPLDREIIVCGQNSSPTVKPNVRGALKYPSRSPPKPEPKSMKLVNAFSLL